MKKKLLVLIGIVTILLCGCTEKITEKKYENEYFSITMQDGFYEKDLAVATVYYESPQVIFTTLKESFEDLKEVNIGENSTIEEYAQAVMENNMTALELQNKDGISYFTYEREISGKEYFYLSSFFKTDDAFWLVAFACENKNKSIYESTFIDWLNTMTFI